MAPGKVRREKAALRGEAPVGAGRRAQQEPSHPHKKNTSDEGRSWRQDPNRVSPFDEKNGKPMQLHILTAMLSFRDLSDVALRRSFRFSRVDAPSEPN